MKLSKYQIQILNTLDNKENYIVYDKFAKVAYIRTIDKTYRINIATFYKLQQLAYIIESHSEGHFTEIYVKAEVL
jgi:hypothetical protein